MNPRDTHNRPLHSSPESLLKEMESCLERLVRADFPSPLDRDFMSVYGTFLSLYGIFQEEILSLSSRRSVCSPGCSVCCSHWAEEVYSFEADIICDYLKKNFPSEIAGITRSLMSSITQYDRIDQIVKARLKDRDDSTMPEDIDPLDLALACFYQLGIPCPLLDEKGQCRIYAIRPLSCRLYINVRDAAFCRQEMIHSGEDATCIIDPGDRIDELLEELHRRYGGTSELRALRPLLAERLSRRD